jgi:hypothetical protein
MSIISLAGENMILSLFLYIMAVLIISFCSYKKKLHLFEVFFIWMTVWLITHSISTILEDNFHLIEFPHDQSKFWVHFFKRSLFYPLMITVLIDLYVRVKSVSLKVMILGASILAPATFEFLFIRLGIIINKGFTFKMALMEWAFTMLLTYVSWLWYRNKRLVR